VPRRQRNGRELIREREKTRRFNHYFDIRPQDTMFHREKENALREFRPCAFFQKIFRVDMALTGGLFLI